MRTFDQATRQGLVLRRGEDQPQAAGSVAEGSISPLARLKPGGHAVAFVGLYLFTMFLYLRPNELFSGIFGSLQIMKYVAIFAGVSYVISKLGEGEPLTVWTTEIKMVLGLTVLAVVLIPIAKTPQESIDYLNETFSKVVIIFIMLINLTTSRKRLISLVNLVLAGGTYIAIGAIDKYRTGELALKAHGLSRIEGVGGGMFGNPNDLANALDMLLPLAVVMAVGRKGVSRYLYITCTLLLSIAVLVTLSRGAFLGLLGLGAVLVWKLGEGRRLKAIFIGLVVIAVLSVAAPGNFGKRMITIFNPNTDSTGSSEQRRALLERALIIAVKHPLGVGMANFHHFSVNEEKAHNSFLEISSELGVLGLLFYLVIHVAPFRALRRVERQTKDSPDEKDREIYLLSVALQAILVAYVICSFFASIQYFWNLYYPVAFAVALHAIHERERASSTGPTPSADAAPPGPENGRKLPRGVLWKMRPQREAGGH